MIVALFSKWGWHKGMAQKPPFSSIFTQWGFAEPLLIELHLMVTGHSSHHPFQVEYDHHFSEVSIRGELQISFVATWRPLHMMYQWNNQKIIINIFSKKRFETAIFNPKTSLWDPFRHRESAIALDKESSHRISTEIRTSKGKSVSVSVLPLELNKSPFGSPFRQCNLGKHQ